MSTKAASILTAILGLAGCSHAASKPLTPNEQYDRHAVIKAFARTGITSYISESVGDACGRVDNDSGVACITLRLKPGCAYPHLDPTLLPDGLYEAGAGALIFTRCNNDWIAAFVFASPSTEAARLASYTSALRAKHLVVSTRGNVAVIYPTAAKQTALTALAQLG